MAKRGRKSLSEIQQGKAEYEKIMCRHCSKEIPNLDGHADYVVVNVWSNCDGVNWPIAVRLHRDCLNDFVKNNSDRLYGLSKLEILKD